MLFLLRTPTIYDQHGSKQHFLWLVQKSKSKFILTYSKYILQNNLLEIGPSYRWEKERLQRTHREEEVINYRRILSKLICYLAVDFWNHKDPGIQCLSISYSPHNLMYLNTWFPVVELFEKDEEVWPCWRCVTGGMGTFLCLVEKDVSKLLASVPSGPCYDGHTYNFWNCMPQ